MAATRSFLVHRKDFSQTKYQTTDALPEPGPGQILMKVERFSYTANNISYAATGDVLRYWEFFPAEEGFGITPVWGFAEVTASQCEGVEVGERFYGYYPMGSHLLAEPGNIKPTGFIDQAAHRQPLSVIYNQYVNCSKDPLYQADTEEMQMLLRPLFTTSFLLDDFFDDNQFFGASNLILTSASSKTAAGMAYALHRNRSKRDHDYKIIGLTSASNKVFVEKLGCYDEVITYDQIEQLDATQPSAIVDFAGNGDVLKRLHAQLAPQLQYSCLVGASHWDQRGKTKKDLDGPHPIMFFAPTQAEKRLNEWGGSVFQQRLADLWLAFTAFAQGWIEVENISDPKAVANIYQTVLAGDQSPSAGYILSLSQ
ncbi:DUF2855 family protein [Pseudomaricurvus alkylphenolicus]|jgi:hypothetical protein|uniref:DUF2855 family protein n=1 Tax=Pseudomaricurvus alkylphenolicus TaxID=1306991 RepID=UPI001422B753|nr:DUF2855 family protein [Pseudomaricurvus alkylphenolicus]NIB40856.1 DUF2855 family protein [Pseudomaricurvus alkylphenolicus]